MDCSATCLLALALSSLAWFAVVFSFVARRMRRRQRRRGSYVMTGEGWDVE